MTWLSMDNVSVELGQKIIVDKVNIQIQEGEIACLLGASGCGKTTLLRSIAGFEKLTHGQIVLDQNCLSDGKKHLPAHQRQVGMVFQDYALFAHLTVYDNIAFGLHGKNQAEKKERVLQLLDLIGLANYAKAYPHELSGGQQQRVALARALAPKPKLLLLDEPFSNLDAELRLQLAKDIRQLLKQEGVTAILVTHDQDEAFAFADKIGLLSAGQLQQWGSPEVLFYQPKNAIVADFFGQGRWLSAKVLDQKSIATILGVYEHHEAHGLEIGDVQLLVRPHEVICVEEGTSALVVSHVFQGEHVQYTLQLPNQEVLLANWSGQDYLNSHVKLALQLVNVIAFS